MGEALRFKTTSSILIDGPSGCGKTCFTESLLLDHLEELFVNSPPAIHYCYGAWQYEFREMNSYDQRVAGLIHQTFTSSKYHRVVLVLGHVSTREIRKDYFQERPLHHSLRKSTTLIRDEEFTSSSFSYLLAS